MLMRENAMWGRGDGGNGGGRGLMMDDGDAM